MNTTLARQIATGALLAGISVGAGAFGAHFLKTKLDPHYLEVYETAVRYQLIHSLAIILAALVGTQIKVPKLVVGLFIAGIVLFSGSLYVLVAGSTADPNPVRVAGAITPLGGLSFISAWVLLAYHALKNNPTQ